MGFRWSAGCAAGGVAVWLLLHFFRYPGLIEELLLAAPLIAIPLGLRFVDGGEPAIGVARLFQPIAALCVVASFQFQQGPVAGMLALPWLAVAGVCAWQAVGYIRLSGFSPGLVGMVFFAVGGAWLAASRYGLAPMGFNEKIVLLTSVHFHYAGFSACVITMMAGLAMRERPGALRFAEISVMMATPLLAIGITYSRLVELIAAVWLAAGMIALGWLLVTRVSGAYSGWRAVLLRAAGASLFASMSLAAAYAIGGFPERGPLDIPMMARTHGYLNAFGFAIPALLAFQERDA